MSKNCVMFFQPKDDFFGSKNEVQILAQMTEVSLKIKKQFAKQPMSPQGRLTVRSGSPESQGSPTHWESVHEVHCSQQQSQLQFEKKILHLLHCAGCELRYSYWRVISQVANISNGVNKLSANPFHKRKVQIFGDCPDTPSSAGLALMLCWNSKQWKYRSS